jgi:hypothetical protein
MLAGVECMAEGHSFHRCRNAILVCYSWAMDKFLQAIDRIYRLNSPDDVNVYVVICEGTIDRKLEAMTQEKTDAAELVLDGHLLGENPSEVNLHEFLRIAHKEFDSLSANATVDERKLVKEWPTLRAKLAAAARLWSSLPGSQLNGAADNIITFPKPELTEHDKLFADLPLWKQMAG